MKNISKLTNSDQTLVERECEGRDMDGKKVNNREIESNCESEVLVEEEGCLREGGAVSYVSMPWRGVLISDLALSVCFLAELREERGDGKEVGGVCESALRRGRCVLDTRKNTRRERSVPFRMRAALCTCVDRREREERERREKCRQEERENIEKREKVQQEEKEKREKISQLEILKRTSKREFTELVPSTSMDMSCSLNWLSICPQSQLLLGAANHNRVYTWQFPC